MIAGQVREALECGAGPIGMSLGMSEPLPGPSYWAATTTHKTKTQAENTVNLSGEAISN